METSKEKAWGCLTDQEKQSIHLTLGQGLSGCEAAEILSITHYKYLELKARSETFFKMFSDFFDKHPSLVRPQAPIHRAFHDFIYGCAQKRLPLSEACKYAGEGRWSVLSTRMPDILSGLKALQVSTNEWDKDLFLLLQEFDRWNSFRVLPHEFRAPSPYKRKSNRQAKYYLNYLRGMGENVTLFITKRYSYHGKKSIFICLFGSHYEDGYKVLSVKNEKSTTEYLTSLQIYIFPTEVDAIKFSLLVIQQPLVLTPRDGQRFWTVYQGVVSAALNYEQIDHTTKARDIQDIQFRESYKR